MDGEAGGQYTTAYYSMNFGRCERNVFKDIFKEEPPSFNKVFGRTPDYTWNVSCMMNINTNNSVYFDSLHSGVAASDAYPTYSLEYHAGENPYYY